MAPEVMQIALRHGLGKELSKLPGDLTRRPFAPAVNLERFTNALDPRWRTARLTLAYRALVWEVDDQTLFVWNIVRHPEDERLSEARRFGRDALRGGFLIEEFTQRLSERTVSDGPDSMERLRLDVADKDLLRLGLSPDLVRLLRCLRGTDDLNALANVTSEAVTPYLHAALRLHDGDSLEVVAAELQANPPPRLPTPELTAALDEELRRGTVRVISSEPELAKALEAPWEIWQLFLHNDQHDAAYKPSWNGACRVTGGPGTGKSVVALHRVKHLVAGRLALGPKVLLTSFSKSGTLALQSQLESLLGPVHAKLVHVAHVDRLVGEILGRQDHGLKGWDPLDEHAIVVRFVAAMEGSSLSVSPAVVAEFWDSVLIAVPEQTFESVQAFRVRIRGIPRLTRGTFDQLLECSSRVEASLAEDRKTTHALRAREALRLLAESGPRYDHVVVDEAQDLRPIHAKLLRALVREGPDDLFLVGDSAQRIYRQPFPLSSVGIRTHNRRRHLKIAYRSSREILEFAEKILTGQELDDLDGRVEHTNAARSIVGGVNPTLHGYVDEASEMRAVKELIVDLRGRGFAANEIMLLAPWNPRCHQFAEELDRMGIVTTLLEEHGGQKPQGVLIATYFRAKGFEARVAIVTGAGESYTEQGSSDGFPRDRRVRALYVACTRPRDELHVRWHGRPSPLIVPPSSQSSKDQAT